MRIHALRPATPFLLTVMIVSVAACDDKDATVVCGGIEKTESDLGYFNLGRLQLGTVIDLDPVTHVANRPITVQPLPADLAPKTDTVDATSLTRRTDFEVDADVEAAVKAKLKTSVNANTVFSITNSWRQDVSDPIGLINRDPNARKRLSTSSAHILLVVGSLVYGDRLSITLKNGQQTSSGLKLMVADISFTVKYDCTSEVQQAAKSGAPFLWKATEARMGPGNELVPDNTEYRLADYNMAPVLADR